MFIFGRSLRRTRECVQLDGEIESARRMISNLRQQRDSLNSSQARRGRRDDLVAELARAGCGANYAQEYEQQQQRRRRQQNNSFFSLWEDEDSDEERGGGGFAQPQQQQPLPFASYRTMCVRSCDGYFFPISFATTQSRFRDDETKCKSSCAAPAELYIYRNPGEEVEQMVSLNGQPYAQSKNAFKHRKTYVKGCSCKPEEYSLQEINQSDGAPRKQADAAPASTPRAASQQPAEGGGRRQ
jgi:hypothetical protein